MGGRSGQGRRYTGLGGVERKGAGGVLDVLGDSVDQADLKGRCSRDRLAARDHVERPVRRDQAGQQDRAARAGDDAEIDLGQAQLRARGRDPVGTAERNLQPAAKCDALDGRNPWFARAASCRTTSGSAGSCGGRPNSRISAPAMKLSPAPRRMAALMSGSASIRVMASTAPRGSHGSAR
jgi:hypothetical protein